MWRVFAVNGNFDDAQTGVKKVFADAGVAADLEARGIRLSSANSINWGRLVPQIVYYFYTYFRLAETARRGLGQAGGLLRSHRQLRRYPGRLLCQAHGPAGGAS